MILDVFWRYGRDILKKLMCIMRKRKGSGWLLGFFGWVITQVELPSAGMQRLWMEQIWGKGEFGLGLDYLLDIYVEMSGTLFFSPMKVLWKLNK